jgi:hypothetical protein
MVGFNERRASLVAADVSLIGAGIDQLAPFALLRDGTRVSKAEATRMAWLEKAIADRHLCPRGYIIIGKTFVAAEEVALGQTDNIVYHGLCIGWTSLTACSNVPRVLSLGSRLVVCDEIRMLLHEGAGSAQKVQQALSFQGRLPIFL